MAGVGILGLGASFQIGGVGLFYPCCFIFLVFGVLCVSFPHYGGVTYLGFYLFCGVTSCVSSFVRRFLEPPSSKPTCASNLEDPLEAGLPTRGASSGTFGG